MTFGEIGTGLTCEIEFHYRYKFSINEDGIYILNLYILYVSLSCKEKMCFCIFYHSFMGYIIRESKLVGWLIDS